MSNAVIINNGSCPVLPPVLPPAPPVEGLGLSEQERAAGTMGWRVWQSRAGQREETGTVRGTERENYQIRRHGSQAARAPQGQILWPFQAQPFSLLSPPA